MAVITRVYPNYTEARRAVDVIEALHLSGTEAAILANEEIGHLHEGAVHEAGSGAATGAGVGAAIGGGAGLLAGLGILAIPGLGPLVAAGWLAAAAAGAAGGALAGGAVGALADLGLSEEEAPVFSEAIRRGNVAVSIRFEEADRHRIETALGTLPAQDYNRLRQDFEEDGWRYDETEAERQARLARDVPPPPPFV